MAYVQADLDADIAGITSSFDDIVARVANIKINWPQVQSLHPGVTPEDYIKREVPLLRLNTGAAVALVESGTTTAHAATRLTGVARTTIRRRMGANAPITKPTTMTGKTAPGPAIGSRKEKKGVTAPLVVPTIAGIPQPPKPSPEAAEALALLKKVADLDTNRILMTVTPTQHARLRKAAKRAEKICQMLDTSISTFP